MIIIKKNHWGTAEKEFSTKSLQKDLFHATFFLRSESNGFVLLCKVRFISISFSLSVYLCLSLSISQPPWFLLFRFWCSPSLGLVKSSRSKDFLGFRNLTAEVFFSEEKLECDFLSLKIYSAFFLFFFPLPLCLGFSPLLMADKWLPVSFNNENVHVKI